MRTMLIALCIHGLALGPALADAATSPATQGPQPRGVSQQLAQAPLVGVPLLAIGVGAAAVVGVAVAVSASNDDKKSTPSTE